MFIAIPMAVFGADHLSDARDIMRIVPSWIPGPLFWTYFVGVCLIAAAVSIILRIQVRLSSILLSIMLLLFVVLMHIPNALAKPGDRFRWIVAARDLSFSLGALTLGIAEGRRSTFEERLLTAVQFALAAIAVFFGIEHLRHPQCVPGVPLEKLMPAWIPLRQLWTSLTGVALILGGIAMFIGRSRQIAAEALGGLVLAWVLVLYVPMMIMTPNIDCLNYVFDTLVYAGVFLVTASAVAQPVQISRDIGLPASTVH